MCNDAAREMHWHHPSHDQEETPTCTTAREQASTCAHTLFHSLCRGRLSAGHSSPDNCAEKAWEWEEGGQEEALPRIVQGCCGGGRFGEQGAVLKLLRAQQVAQAPHSLGEGLKDAGRHRRTHGESHARTRRMTRKYHSQRVVGDETRRIFVVSAQLVFFQLGRCSTPARNVIC